MGGTGVTRMARYTVKGTTLVDDMDHVEYMKSMESNGIVQIQHNHMGITRDATNDGNYNNGTQRCRLYNMACNYTKPHNLLELTQMTWNRADDTE